jgi:hypothetical protein
MKITFAAFAVLITLVSCNKENAFENYYRKHRPEIQSLTRECDSFVNYYQFLGFQIRGGGGTIETQIDIGRGYQTATLYFKKRPLEAIEYSKCDSCGSEVRQKYASLDKDPMLKDILKKYIDLDCRALGINQQGVFVVLDDAIKGTWTQKIWNDDEAGIFVSFKDSVWSGGVIKRLDDHAFVYQDRIIAW